MDVQHLADLIAAKTRIRAGGLEGVIVGFRAVGDRAVLTIDHGGAEPLQVEVSSMPEELEPVDRAAVDAHWETVAEADRVKMAQRAKSRALEVLGPLDVDQLREVLSDVLDQIGHRKPA